MSDDYVKSSIVGFTLADALGVPVEFQSREIMKRYPLKEMKGYGTHSQPVGTWSDDSSMLLATVDSIIEKEKIDYNDIMKKYCDWAQNANYTATDCVFDMGITTTNSIRRFLNEGITAEKCGDSGFNNNGNGSLMRVLPVAIYLSNSNLSETEKADIINKFSSITHQHEISRFGCRVYCDFVDELIKNGMNKEQALENITKKDYSSEYSEETLNVYGRILDGSIKDAFEDQVRGSGYVLHTLEASLWALFQSDSYENAVLKAINLGEDTDTVGAVTGSLAGMVYGYENIPSEWLSKLRKKDYIEELSDKFSKVLFIDKVSKDNSDKDIYII